MTQNACSVVSLSSSLRFRTRPRYYISLRPFRYFLFAQCSLTSRCPCFCRHSIRVWLSMVAITAITVETGPKHFNNPIIVAFRIKPSLLLLRPRKFLSCPFRTCVQRFINNESLASTEIHSIIDMLPPWTWQREGVKSEEQYFHFIQHDTSLWVRSEPTLRTKQHRSVTYTYAFLIASFEFRCVLPLTFWMALWRAAGRYFSSQSAAPKCSSCSEGDDIRNIRDGKEPYLPTWRRFLLQRHAEKRRWRGVD